MSKVTDFFIVSRGSPNPTAGPITQIPKETLNPLLKKYLAKAAASERRIVGADIDAGMGAIDEAIKRFADFVIKEAGGSTKIGVASIVGMSNGAALALGLAAELANRAAPQLNYFGVTNVPMFAAGRNPPIPRVGSMKTINEPTTHGGLKGKDLLPFGAWAFARSSVDVTHDQSDPPKAKLDVGIGARKTCCFYEVEGNHVIWVRKTVVPHWDWWSEMEGEVHGEIVDFKENKRFKATGNTDLERHQSVCQGSAFSEMKQQAADALADF